MIFGLFGMSIRVLNIASFIPIQGLPSENDISLKIYHHLKEDFDVETIFVKPVRVMPRPFHLATPNVQRFRHIFLNNSYVDSSYGVPVRFFDQGFSLTRKLLRIRAGTPSHLEWRLRKQRLLRIVQDFKPSLIHAHEIVPSGYYAQKLSQYFRIPYLVTLRGEYRPQIYESKKGQTILSNAKALTTPSWSLYKKLKKKHRIHLIPHGLDEFWFKRIPKTQEYGNLRLITVSRLIAMKNIHLVLRALGALKKAGRTFDYTIVGDGPERSRLERDVELHSLESMVNIVGSKNADDIVTLLSESDIFILPSFPETFGRAYCEAAAQGVVPIGIKGTGINGYFNQKHGFFLDRNADIVTQLVTVLSAVNSRILEPMREACINKAQQMKTDQVIKKYFDLIYNAA